MPTVKPRSPRPARPSRTLYQRNTHAPVLLALLLDLRDAHGADLGDVAHMGAAARLQVEPGDFDQPHAAGAHRRLHRHGLDQTGIGFEFGIADPAVKHGGAGCDHLIYFGADGVLVEAGFRDVEIEPAFGFADRA